MMRSLLILVTPLMLAACAKKESRPESSGSSGSATGSSVAPASNEPAVAGSAATTGSGSATETPPENDGADEVAQLVVKTVGSKALGNQTIEASCVSVVIMPAGEWTVAAARLKDCGDKTARTILWLYKRGKGGKWNEDYVGQPPKCWKGVPPDIAEAVWKATSIPNC